MCGCPQTGTWSNRNMVVHGSVCVCVTERERQKLEKYNTWSSILEVEAQSKASHPGLCKDACGLHHLKDARDKQQHHEACYAVACCAVSQYDHDPEHMHNVPLLVGHQPTAWLGTFCSSPGTVICNAPPDMAGIFYDSFHGISLTVIGRRSIARTICLHEISTPRVCCGVSRACSISLRFA